MKLRETLDALDRWQRTRGFRAVASGLVALVMVVLIVGAFVRANAPEALADLQAAPLTEEQTPGAEDSITNTDAAERMVLGLLDQARGVTGFVLSVLVVGGVAQVIVWLGLGLTYLGIIAVTAAVIAPLALFDQTRGWATLVGGISSLALSFAVLLRGAQTMLGGRGPVWAIARNVLDEAVRLKLSLVFIVLLIFGLAALPGLMDPEQPLRYRVQSFLQYGTGGTFWLIAVLVVAFSVSTVASEQRDKVLWQTITKPVSAWQYIFGKWLGVSTLAALLLAVNASGVFLFVEYLRNLPAQGEREAFVALGESGVSEDRLILETQILTASRTVYASEPELSVELVDEIIRERVDEIRQRDPTFTLDDATFRDWAEDIYKQGRLLYFAVQPGSMQRYVFRDVRLPRDDVPLTLRYRIDASANQPDAQYRLSFAINDGMPIVRETGLGHTHAMPLTPSIIVPASRRSPAPITVLSDEEPFDDIMAAIRDGRLRGHEVLHAGDLVREDGSIAVDIYNGEVGYAINRATGQIASVQILPNPEPMRFPEQSLSISFPVGSYHINFAKAVFVLWLKLAFLAMLGITAATFLSFSVASLVAFGVFLIAESAPFIKDSLEVYATTDHDNNISFFRVGISAIAHVVSWLFYTYGDLAPVEKIVSGSNVSIGALAKGLGLLASWTGALYLLAVVVFRRRELAIYSGH
ncbi:MAG: ABC transporter permease [Phycisphaerales bacterium]